MSIYFKDAWENIAELGKTIAICFLVFCGFYIFQTPIIDAAKEIFVEHIFNEPKLDSYADFLGIILLFSGITFCAIRITVYKLRPTLKSIIVHTTIISTYFLIFRYNEAFKYYYIFKKSPVAYLDILFCLAPVFFWRYKAYAEVKTDSSRLSFFEDQFDEKKEEDLFSRTGIADRLVELIDNTKTVSAFAIAVIGKWGSGKSVFLKFLKKRLKKQNEIVEFNPWKVKDTNQIYDSFFKSLSKAVSKYDKNTAKQIREYAEYLTEIDDDSFFSKVIKSTVTTFGKEKGLFERFELINKSLKLTGKRFIVFVDDLDRLTGKEIIQTLKLVRNAADFGNVFFIAALDYNYVSGAMKKTNEVVDEEKFLQKIFQYEMVLTPIRKEFITSQLRQKLSISSKTIEERQAFESAFEKLILKNKRSAYSGQSVSEEDFEKAFDNMRDLTRFVNSFQLSYSFLAGVVEIDDLLIVELIKLKSVYLYQILAEKKIVRVQNTGYVHYVFDSSIFNKYYAEKIEANDRPLLTSLLQNLFPSNAPNGQTQSIIYPSNFDFYVHMQLFDKISASDWNNIKGKTWFIIYKKLEEWIIEKKDNDVKDILLNLDSFDSFLDLCKFVKVYLMIDNHFEKIDFTKHAFSFFKSITVLRKKYSTDDNSIKAFFSSIVYDKEIEIDARLKFLSFVLDDYNPNQQLLSIINADLLFQHLTALLSLYQNSHNHFQLRYVYQISKLLIQLNKYFKVKIPDDIKMIVAACLMNFKFTSFFDVFETTLMEGEHVATFNPGLQIMFPQIGDIKQFVFESAYFKEMKNAEIKKMIENQLLIYSDTDPTGDFHVDGYDLITKMIDNL